MDLKSECIDKNIKIFTQLCKKNTQSMIERTQLKKLFLMSCNQRNY